MPSVYRYAVAIVIAGAICLSLGRELVASYQRLGSAISASVKR